MAARTSTRKAASSTLLGCHDAWSDPDPDGVPADVSQRPGNPALIQSRFGVQGNFELIVPLAVGGLAHYWSNNDDPRHPWPLGEVFGADRVDAVSLDDADHSAAVYRIFLGWRVWPLTVAASCGPSWVGSCPSSFNTVPLDAFTSMYLVPDLAVPKARDPAKRHRVGHSGSCMAREGIEPPTRGFSGRRRLIR